MQYLTLEEIMKPWIGGEKPMSDENILKPTLERITNSFNEIEKDLTEIRHKLINIIDHFEIKDSETLEEPNLIE